MYYIVAVSLVPHGFIFCHINCSCRSLREKTIIFCCRGCPLHKLVLWHIFRFFTTVIPDYRHIWLTQCGKFQVKNCTEVFAMCIKLDLFPTQLDDWRNIVFFIFTWLEFQNWQTNRERSFLKTLTDLHNWGQILTQS